MTWARRFNEFDPSDIRPRFFGVHGEGAGPNVSLILSLTRFDRRGRSGERLGGVLEKEWA
jgi:hypothetical protein